MTLCFPSRGLLREKEGKMPYLLWDPSPLSDVLGDSTGSCWSCRTERKPVRSRGKEAHVLLLKQHTHRLLEVGVSGTSL